jgi:hypothetical protein
MIFAVYLLYSKVENWVLRRISGLKTEKVTAGWKI